MSNTPTHRKNSVSSSVVNLGKPSLRRRLEAYYSLIAPDAISNQEEWKIKFDLIYQKYGGTIAGEAKLQTKLAKKYGNKVSLLTVKEVDRRKSHEGRLCGEQHDEHYYQLTPQQQDSGVLDMTSPSFDPVATILRARESHVLQSNQPWLGQESSVLNFMDQCRKLLPDCDPLQQVLRPAPPKKISTAPKKRNTSAFAALAEEHSKGPLVLLYNCMMQRHRVRILIRYVNGIRGTLTGYLVAFDKHMNMICRDVEEVYTPRYIRDEEAEGSQPLSNVEIEVQRRIRALQEGNLKKGSGDWPAISGWGVRQRYLKQIMIRGDNVVLVYRAERERFSWPRTSQSPMTSLYSNAASVPLLPPSERIGSPGSLVFAVHEKEREKFRTY